MISDLPLSPAVWRDKTAVGTYLKLIARICSPYPGIIRSHTYRKKVGKISVRCARVLRFFNLIRTRLANTTSQHRWWRARKFQIISTPEQCTSVIFYRASYRFCCFWCYVSGCWSCPSSGHHKAASIFIAQLLEGSFNERTLIRDHPINNLPSENKGLKMYLLI